MFEREDYFDIQELSHHLMDHPAIPTIYDWVYKKKVPFIKIGRKLYFNKEKIEQWQKYGRPVNQF